jgi:hypothetical protein
LYSRIKDAAEQDKVERLVDVERDIQAFLKYYPLDRRSRELQSYLDEIDLNRLERRFEFRGKFLAKNDTLGPVERAYVEAISYVQLDPSVGRKKMQALVDLYRDMPEASKQARECLMLAQKQVTRLDRLATVAETDARRLVEKQLARAAALHPDDPATAERLRNAVIELYGNEPWAVELVDRARKSPEQPPTEVVRQTRP